MRIILLVWFGCFLVTAFSCNQCDHAVNFGCLAANKGDTAYIYVDDQLVYKKVFGAAYFESRETIKPSVRDYCASADSIKVRAGFNRHDTIFYLNPREIKECYVGNSIYGDLLVFYNHVKKKRMSSAMH
ncbi:hypothetical protein [Chitinophaga ginsengisoli]|uniref:Uncharacterized protein n=1 Tax=Chitinophaga ginsengisoli TaxID=363837 RepID=A0A2P8FDW8_9BACT|nr:hypothetical protein [Chitinophaga ginsengisoli]PSL19904.1 hypothetical protein CLV42_12616 [Chitinophaga ginsengisoli]